MIELKIKEFLDKHELNATFICRYEDDVSSYVEVYVPQENFGKALSLDTYQEFPDYYFRWHQVMPPLIPANLGDFVLIYNEYRSKEDSEVGVVTSIITTNDDISYGCAYFIPTFSNQRHDFLLTSDNYGGYKKGFIKILSDEEFKDILIYKINKTHAEKIDRINEKKEIAIKNINKTISKLKDTTAHNIKKIQFADLGFMINSQNTIY